MSGERRSPSQETIDNTVAIATLVSVSQRTTTDVDKLVKHIERFLPVHEKLANLKKILYGGLTLGLAFVLWMTTEHYTLSSRVNADIAVKEERYGDVMDKINKNKNQITYLKGRIK